jgi:hypothetical protein
MTLEQLFMFTSVSRFKDLKILLQLINRLKMQPEIKFWNTVEVFLIITVLENLERNLWPEVLAKLESLW